MKYIPITILLTLSVLLFAGGTFNSKETSYYKQQDNNYDSSKHNVDNYHADSHYGKQEEVTQNSNFNSQYTSYSNQAEGTEGACKSCGEPAKLLPYHGEDIPLAELFPCPSIAGCNKNEGRMY